MINSDFITDVALETAEQAKLGDLCKKTQLSYGIERRFLNINTIELEKKAGRKRGVYVTFDLSQSVYENNRAAEALEKYISNTVSEMNGVVPRTSTVLIAGLGNGDIVADALGSKTVGRIAVTRQKIQAGAEHRHCVCALETGVYGATGIQSTEILRAVVKEIRPTLVILIDSLATSSVHRLGKSYQISTSGIAPGSGVGQDKEKIDKSVLGVPVIAIGVPLMLSMRTAMSGFMHSYFEETGAESDEFKLRTKLMEAGFSNLVVAPKEINYYVDMASLVVANALNRTFSE